MVGFEMANQDGINSLYLCQVCSLILREPYQLECGHRQCETCIDTIEGEVIKCVECPTETPKNRAMRDRGFKNDMKLINVPCSLCEWKGIYKDYEGHLNQPHSNLTCEFCEQKFGSKLTLDEHKEKNCTKKNSILTSTDDGCSTSICRNQLLEDRPNTIHQSTTSNHLEHELSDAHSSSQMEIGIGKAFPVEVSESTNENSDTDMMDIHDAINILAASADTITDNIEYLERTVGPLRALIETVREDMAALQSAREEHDALVSGIQLNQQFLEQEVASLKQQAYDLLHASYDGMTLWRIDNVGQQMRNAQLERPASIYSPPFYSSPTGYKMRARLYLNGFQSGRYTHMSLAFILMRNSYDAILSFPFNFKVTFCLYDQSSAQLHHIHSFLPDIRSACFQRPRLDMNIERDIPQFFPLSAIQQEGNPYVRDDTMFIKVIVDFGSMPESIIPYALSLSPGLPMHIQQKKIKEEIERRAQQ